MKYLFYPGCSLLRNARPYLDSLSAIQDCIDIQLEEVEDWNCCGATEYMAVHRLAAKALVGRNLALAQKQVNGTKTLMAACSSCYLNLTKTDDYLGKYKELNQKVNVSLRAGGLHYSPGSLEIRHLLDVLYNDVGLERIQAAVKRPLTGIRIAPYYGCMIVRPDPNNRWNNPEYPTALDEILTVLGAQVIDFPLKTHCCSGHMTQISPEVAYELIRRLISGADQYLSDIIVTLCPMCQFNLDVYQGEMNRFFKTNYHMPVLYFTQLMGLAFGLEAEELGIGKEFVNARSALEKIGIVVPEVEDKSKPRRKKKKKEEGLPMPRMQDHDQEEYHVR